MIEKEQEFDEEFWKKSIFNIWGEAKAIEIIGLISIIVGIE